jgi:TP901 family phage tail tape measure protein
MASKEAAVRLELKDAGFRRGIKAAETAVKGSAAKMGVALRTSLSRGAKGGLTAVRGMFSTIKQGMVQMGSLAVGIGFGALVKSAIDAEQVFRKLSFTVSAGSGAWTEYDDLQKQAQASAVKWGQSTDDLAGAMDEVFNTVGNLDFTRATMDEIAKASRASGQEVSTIAPLVAEMNRQFGLSAEQVPEALASVLSLGSKGGLSVEDLSRGMNMLGSLARATGQEGEEGMRTMIALGNTISAASGKPRSAISDLNMALATMLDSTKLAAVKKEFGIDVDKEGLNALDRLKEVIAAAKGDPSGLIKIFGADLGATLASGFGGLEDFDAAMADASRSALTAADVTDKANKNRTSAEANIKRGIEGLKKAFTAPAFVDAITKLTEVMPELAEAVASVVSFITENPALSAGAVLGGTFARGAVTSMIGGGPGAGGGAAFGAAATGAMSKGAGGVGGAIARAFAAAPAILLAGAAIGAAIEQGVKLADDLAKHEKDVNDERVNLMENAERLGDKVVRREQGGFLGGEEFLARDVRGKVQAFGTREEAEAAGGQVRIGMRESDETPLARIKRQQAEQDVDLGSIFGRGPNDAASLGPLGMGVTGKAPAADPKAAAANAAASAKAMGAEIRSAQLKASITNTNEMAAAIAAAMPTPPPTPGPAGRQ